MAPAFRPMYFQNVEPFLFIVKELTVPYFKFVMKEQFSCSNLQNRKQLSHNAFRRPAVERKGARYEQPLQIERIHSRVQQPCRFIGTKEIIYIRKELNTQRIVMVHQHTHRFIVLQHQLGCHMSSYAYTLYLTLLCFLLVKIHYYFKPSNKRTEKS